MPLRCFLTRENWALGDKVAFHSLRARGSPTATLHRAEGGGPPETLRFHAHYSPQRAFPLARGVRVLDTSCFLPVGFSDSAPDQQRPATLGLRLSPPP